MPLKAPSTAHSSAMKETMGKFQYMYVAAREATMGSEVSNPINCGANPMKMKANGNRAIIEIWHALQHESLARVALRAPIH